MPTVTGFEGNAPLGDGRKGLKTTDNSASPGEVMGTDLSDGLKVTVVASATLSWKGDLNFVGGQYRVNLKCTNTTKTEEKPRDTEEVSVTAGTSLPFQTTVETGP